eukprot:TRINITY_DN15844_c0_g1_i1.p1 TRINITY_DN15844_c0_g1~~TRINITY_DN15844_c0_g1_i1.p1  ORF type:complete len:125 (+),score=1.68 TRINITY_DN15844_c0_g1_i1:180-554(+)
MPRLQQKLKPMIMRRSSIFCLPAHTPQVELVAFHTFMQQNRRAWIVDPRDQQRIIMDVHDAEHRGRHKTNEKVKERYNWLGLSNDVKAYVASCEHCQRLNALGRFRRADRCAPSSTTVDISSSV